MIINYDDLNKIRKNFANKKIVLIKGTFDLFHIGHLYTLQKAKSYGDILVVIVKCDDIVKQKGSDRPIITEKSRAKIVDAIKYVDYTIIANKTFDVKDLSNVCICSEKDIIQYKLYANIISNLRPNILICPKGYEIPNSLAPIYNEVGTEIIKIDRVPKLGSTTDIIDSIEVKIIKSNKI